MAKSRKNGSAPKGAGGTTEPVHIAAVLARVLNKYSRKAGFDLALILDLWPAIVDGTTAANTRPSACKGSVLLVNVSSPVWRHHLQFEKDRIVERINAALRQRAVADIKFVVGPM